MKKLEALGMVQVEHQKRPFYSARMIKRGQDRGKVEVKIRSKGKRFKLVKLQLKALRFFTHDMGSENNSTN